MHPRLSGVIAVAMVRMGVALKKNRSASCICDSDINQASASSLEMRFRATLKATIKRAAQYAKASS